MALEVSLKFNINAENNKGIDELFASSIASEERSPSDCGSGASDPENSFLLGLLKDLNEWPQTTIGDKLMDELSERLFNLDNDLTNRCFNRESFVRQQVETVIENMNSKNNKINILEVSRSDVTLAQTVIQMIRLSTFDMKISYALVHPMADRLDEDLIADVDCHQWDYRERARLPSDMKNLDLIIYEDKYQILNSDLTHDLTLEPLWNALKDNGFLIVINKTKLNFAEEVLAKVLAKLRNNNEPKLKIVGDDQLIERKNLILSEAQSVGFTLIATKTDVISNKDSLILRKLSSDICLERQILIPITSDKCEQWIEKLQNALNSIDSRPESDNVWIIAEDCPTNGVIGLVNCLRKEPNGHRIRCILDYDFDSKEKTSILRNKRLLKAIVKKDLVMNVLKNMSYDDMTGSFKHFTINANKNLVPTEHCYLNVQTRGDLSSFGWYESQHKYWPVGKKDNQELIQVYYAPLNFRDIMLATGNVMSY